jgi:hypothetical protein
MKKRPTRKLEIEVYEEQLQQFCLALLELKASDKISKDKVRVLLDAIHYDPQDTMKELTLTDEERVRLMGWLRNIHAFLEKASKDQIGYKQVATNSWKEFERSEFAAEVHEVFGMFLFHRKMLGKNGSLDVNVLAALLSSIVGKIVNGLRASLSIGLGKAIQVKNYLQQPYTISIGDTGKLSLATNDESMDIELFVEVNGSITKANEVPENIDPAAIRVVYIVSENNTAIRQVKYEDHVEVTTLANVKLAADKLDLSGAVQVEVIHFPKEGMNFAQINENTFTYTPEAKEARPTADDLSRHSLIEDDQPEDQETITPISSALGDYLDEVLRFDGTKRGEVEYRDKVILAITAILRKHHPDLTNHVRDTITGFTCAQMRLLEREEQYASSNNKASYRKYLRDTVAHALRRSAQG